VSALCKRTAALVVSRLAVGRSTATMYTQLGEGLTVCMVNEKKNFIRASLGHVPPGYVSMG